MKVRVFRFLVFLILVFSFAPVPAFSDDGEGEGFLLFRHSRGLRSWYGQFKREKVIFPAIWFLDDPNNNYQEGSFGLGYELFNTPHFKLDATANALFAGIGSREYSTYFQPALTPSFTFWKLNGFGVFLFDIPLRHEDTFSFILDTLDVNYSLHSKVSVGASLFVLYNRHFQIWRAGPKITFSLPKGIFLEGAFWEGNNNGDEFQIRFGLNF